MSTLSALKDYWKVVLLVILLCASTFALVTPSAGTQTETVANETAATQSSAVDLKYGLELAGGTRVRAPLDGVMATNTRVNVSNREEITTTLAQELDVKPYNVRIRPQSNAGGEVTSTIEVYADVRVTAFRSALRKAGVYTTETEVSAEVSQATYDEAEETLNARIVQSGLSGGSVRQAVGNDGTRYLVVSVPNENQTEVLNLVQDRGVVRIEAVYPAEAGNPNSSYNETTVLTQAGIQSVGQIESERGSGYGVPVTLSDQAAADYVTQLQTAGYLSDEGIENCQVKEAERGVSSRGYCLMTYQDDEFLHGAGISQGLASEMQSGDFQQSPTLVMYSSSREEAQSLAVRLRAGAMPAPMAMDEGTVAYLSPSQASQFKLFSLLIGLLTVVAVGFTVAYRYDETEIVLPMTATALSEVVLLLGFVSLVQLPLDLSHIAGLIAVVGTGVDDLIIITDEVLVSGGASSSRVFQNRFRKAFWVIGVAAITTIIAMSPLAVLSLGDLQGFAIVTIVGVLLGVLVSRPAYGDILRWRLQKDH